MGFPLDQCERIVSRQAQLEAGAAGIDIVARPTAEATALVFQHGARVAGLPVREDAVASIGYRVSLACTGAVSSSAALGHLEAGWIVAYWNEASRDLAMRDLARASETQL